jgi:hypothetical protein
VRPFITYREEDEKGELQYYILQKAFPHYLGRIVEQRLEKSLMQKAIAGYNLYIVFDGSLRGNFVPAYKDVYKEIEDVFHAMADWFYQNRILKEEKKYKKWKIQQ